MWKMFALLAICATRASGSLLAQEVDVDAMNFRGVRVATVLVNELDDDARRCGLNAQSLKQAVELPIRAYTKIKTPPAEAKWDHYLIILEPKALPSANGSFCAYHVELALKKLAPVRLSEGAPLTPKEVVLWRRGGVFLVGSQIGGDHIARVSESMAKTLAVTWQRANP